MPKPNKTALLTAVLLTACTHSWSDAGESNQALQPGAATIHDLQVERAYTLEDSREQAFRDQILEQAVGLCGSRSYALQSTRPVGAEVVRDDFLYRLYDVQIACPG